MPTSAVVAPEVKTTSGLVVKASPGLGPRVKRFTITTDAVDRDGDVVLPQGLELDEYRKNPVFLWAHQFGMPPIGKCVQLGRDGNSSVWADVEFAVDEHADRVFKLYDGGFLNAVSIGFRTLQQGPPDSSLFMPRPDAASRCKRVVYRAKLLEISAVPIPANPEALAMVAKSLGGSDLEALVGQVVGDVLTHVETVDLGRRIAAQVARPENLGAVVDAVLDDVLAAVATRNSS